MRATISSVALGAVLALSAVPESSAASLSGSPFVIAKTPDGRYHKTNISGAAHETSSGDIGVALFEGPRNFGVPATVTYQTFDNSGVTTSDKILVFAGPRTTDYTNSSLPAGALPLADGKALVGYIDRREKKSSPGFFTRIVDESEASPDVTLVYKAEHPFWVTGFLLPLASRGVVIRNDSGRLGYGDGSAANFVAPSGEVDPANIDIARQYSFVDSATPYRDGFIAKYVYVDDGRWREEFAQIFGPDGRKVGPEFRIKEISASDSSSNTRLLGLADGSIAIFRTIEGKLGGYSVDVEIRDGSWMLKATRKTIAWTDDTRSFAATALPDGDLLVAAKVLTKSGSTKGLEVKRWSQSLRVVGAPIRQTGVTGANPQQLLVRKGGDVLLTYTSFSNDKSTIKFSGRFLKP